MSKVKAVSRFNHTCGNAPAEDPKEILKQIVNQSTYLLEEVLETKHAAKDGNWTEVTDGVADILFVAAYLNDLCEAAGVDIKGAFEAVCENNSLKFTTSKELAEKWLAEKEISCYVAETEYDGETYYTVRRTEDGKVTKYKGFETVNLIPFIPKDLLEKEIINV